MFQSSFTWIMPRNNFSNDEIIQRLQFQSSFTWIMPRNIKPEFHMVWGEVVSILLHLDNASE